jgi:hypothetical protein
MANNSSAVAQTKPKQHSELGTVSAGDYVAQRQIDQRLACEPRNSVFPPLESDVPAGASGPARS